MRVAVRREEEHGERAVHIFDTLTGRGLVLGFHGRWDSVNRQDAPEIQRREAMIEYLVQNRYFPRDVSETEFNRMYERVSSNGGLPLVRGLPAIDFDPSETPSLRTIIEETRVDYMVAAAQSLERQSP